MKVSENNDQRLDQLLERPAVLADYGFTNALTDRIKSKEKFRRQIFVGAGIVWLIIFLVSFPAQFVARIFQKTLAISASVQDQAQTLVELDPAVLISQSDSITLLVIFLLGVFAMISLQFRSF